MNYLLFLRCRLCHSKYTMPYSDLGFKRPRKPSQVLQDIAGADYFHDCVHGDVGVARVLGLRPEVKA